MKDPKPKTHIVSNIPKHAFNIYLAYFEYFATGEGYTLEAQIVFDYRDEESDLHPALQFKSLNEVLEHQTKITCTQTLKPEFIPLIIGREEDLLIANDTKKRFYYHEINPKFKLKFLEVWGGLTWNTFMKTCFENNAYIDLISKMRFNHN